MDLIIRGGTLVTPSGESQADVGVLGGRIALLGEDLSQVEAGRVIDASGKIVMPGLIDSMVELWSEPGALPTAEHFAATTRAAACGGVTTTLSPVGIPRGKDPESAVQSALSGLGGKAFTDWGIHLSPSDAPDTASLLRAIRSHGALSVLVDLACERMTDGHLFALFQALAGQALVLARCENGAVIRHLRQSLAGQRPRGGPGHAQTHPAWVEAEAITRAAALAGAAGAHLHVLGVSGQTALEAVRRAKESGGRLLAETAPHHLALSRDLLDAEDGHLWVTNPPLRPKGESQALWRALESGLLDAVSSHHLAVPRAAKRAGQADAAKAVAGLPGVETMLPVLWSEGVEKWRMTPQTLVATCCEMPAKLFGLWPRKGSLDIGSDADLVILDPNQIASVEPARLHMGVDHHPFAAKSLKGWPVGTILRGEVVVENGVPTETPSGQRCERQFALP